MMSMESGSLPGTCMPGKHADMRGRLVQRRVDRAGPSGGGCQADTQPGGRCQVRRRGLLRTAGAQAERQAAAAGLCRALRAGAERGRCRRAAPAGAAGCGSRWARPMRPAAARTARCRTGPASAAPARSPSCPPWGLRARAGGPGSRAARRAHAPPAVRCPPFSSPTPGIRLKQETIQQHFRPLELSYQRRAHASLCFTTRQRACLAPSLERPPERQCTAAAGRLRGGALGGRRAAPHSWLWCRSRPCRKASGGSSGAPSTLFRPTAAPRRP
jgi:hypothetical protein